MAICGLIDDDWQGRNEDAYVSPLQRKSGMILDLWKQLHSIFGPAIDRQPEVTVTNLSSSASQTMIDFMLRNSREVQTAFYKQGTKHKVTVSSADEVATKFAVGELTGGFLIEPIFWGLPLPVLGVFSDESGSFAIDYEMGPQWTPLTLIGFFEFLRMIRTLDNEAVIRFGKGHFGRKWEIRFAATLREYLYETLS
jgi:hypothetical protein